ncbi:MAG: hypothetical protein AAFZ52_11085 [Bacteroidota bacterium]
MKTKGHPLLRYPEIAHKAYLQKRYAALAAIMEAWSDEAIREGKGITYPACVHMSHTYRGLIALERGDVTTAKLELLKSAKVPKSPVLWSFGPNMELAKALLEKGQRKTVLRFLEMIKKFWFAPLRVFMSWGWKKTILAGGIPNFKGNLMYHKGGVNKAR